MKAFSIILTSILVAGSSMAVAAARTNCAAQEKIVFSCSTGKKTISLCASPGQANTPYAEYRFATRSDGITFSYRADATLAHRIFNRATIVGASSASTVIWFTNDGYVYEISDPVKGTPSVSVYKKGKQVGSTTCSGNYSGDAETLNPFIKQRTSEDYFEILDGTSRQ